MGTIYYGYSPIKEEAIAIANLRAANHFPSPCWSPATDYPIVKVEGCSNIWKAKAVAHHRRGSCKINSIVNTNFVATESDTFSNIEEEDVEATIDDWHVEY